MSQLVGELRVAGGDTADVEVTSAVGGRSFTPPVRLTIAAVRERVPHGLGRFGDNAELLRRVGVTAADGQPTVAGMLALGVHPQQWFPATSSRPRRNRCRVTRPEPVPATKS
jgi:hypothetical protein